MHSSASAFQSKRRESNRRRILAGLLLITTVVAIPTMLLGQAYFGTVSGVLADGTGAVVASANVTLTDQQKGYTFTTTSDNGGRYLFRTVPPGVYQVSAEAQGFGKTLSAKFKVDINENATTNVTLKVAGASQSVSVSAEAQAIQTGDAETGQVVNRRFINDLPLIDRNVIELVNLAPGVTEMDDQCDVTCTGTNFVSNGSRGATSDILTDGASVTNSEPNGGITAATYLPSPEAVEEFKVEQTNFSAEYGFSGASVVNMITRSGTNKFHGSAYDFVRDQVLDANNWFNDYYGVPIAPLRRNNYGFTVGGPIFKNKTFFFFDLDASRTTGMSTSFAGVPSDAMRSGDFGAVCGQWGGTFDSTGRCSADSGQIWDPYLRTYDPNPGAPTRNDPSSFIPFNNIALYTSPGSVNLPANLEPPNHPGNLIDPVSQKMLGYFPEPNITSENGIYQNWIGSGPNQSFNRQYDIKIDHRFSQNNLVSGKYSYQYSHGTGFNCFKNFTDPCEGGPNWTNAHAFSINDTHTFSPTLLLNVTLGFTRGVWHIDAYNPQGVNDPLGTLGFPSYLQSNGFTGVPAIFLSTYSSAAYTTQGTDPYGNYRLGQDTGQLSATIDKVHGAHDLKFGFDGRLHQINYIQTNAPVGIFSFDESGSAACPGTSEGNYGQSGIANCGGDAMASFLMGTMNGNSYYEIQFRPATSNYQYGVFGQDNWKVDQKLTLNLGLRYDVTLPRTDRYNHQNSFDPNVASPLNGGSLTYPDEITGQTTTLQLTGGEVFATPGQRTTYVTDWHDLQPRFGFAYQFAPKMVVRGGYGIYYGQSRSGVTGVVPYGGQGFNEYTNMITTYQNNGATPYVHMDNPYPNGLNQPAGNTLGLLNDVGYGANGPLRTAVANRTPYEQSWSLGIEREMPGNIVLNAEYIGKKGTHLPFSGANQLNILGPQIESPSANINGLLTYVDNPFSSQNGGPISDPNSTLSESQVQEFQLQLPHPQFTGVATDVQLIANSIYHGFQFSAEKRYSNGLQFLVTYVWSKSMDDSSQADDNVTWLGSFTSLQDPNKPWEERSLSTFDIPRVLQFSYTYDLPFGRGRAFLGNMPRVLEAVVGGWKTNGLWRLADGRPLTMFVADGIALPTYGGQRPNIVGTPKRNHGHDWINNYFVDPTVFQRPDNYTLGDAARAIGSVRTPWAFNTDLSLSKQFSLREEMNLEFRIEARNAFNHPVFGTPDTSVDDGDFGTISYTSNQPREVQLAVKFNF
jgi:Carboxypeptidase regulatory-like domain/TonB dependent receptor